MSALTPITTKPATRHDGRKGPIATKVQCSKALRIIRRRCRQLWQQTCAVQLHTSANSPIRLVRRQTDSRGQSNHQTVAIHAVNLKNRLGDVETNGRNRLHGKLLRIVGALNSPHIFGTLVPVEEPSTASKAASRTATRFGL